MMTVATASEKLSSAPSGIVCSKTPGETARHDPPGTTVSPRSTAWARRAIPFFPEMGRADRQLLVRLQSPPMERLRDAIEAGLRVSRVTNRDGTTV